MIKMLGLTHLALTVSDLEKSFQFDKAIETRRREDQAPL
jgi:hypothetical protein